eukprot:scaffold16497_cov67-Phaeocystis_antarctica.AAC.1
MIPRYTDRGGPLSAPRHHRPGMPCSRTCGLRQTPARARPAPCLIRTLPHIGTLQLAPSVSHVRRLSERVSPPNGPSVQRSADGCGWGPSSGASEGLPPATLRVARPTVNRPKGRPASHEP